MKAHCGYCGEEILGAVNRCWRCGHRFRRLPAADGQPPVRREPVASSLVTVTVVESPVPGQNPDLEPDFGRLQQIETPQSDRWGTPFRSDFEPSARDRWRRRERRFRDWLCLIVGERRRAPAEPIAEHDSIAERESDSLQSLPPSTASRSPQRKTGRISDGRNSDRSEPPPRTPIATASAVLSGLLGVAALVLLSFPLLALLMAGMAFSLATIAYWTYPRTRTLVLIAVSVLILAVVGATMAGWTAPKSAGNSSEFQDSDQNL
jgi:hypothetical protein